MTYDIDDQDDLKVYDLDYLGLRPRLPRWPRPRPRWPMT